MAYVFVSAKTKMLTTRGRQQPCRGGEPRGPFGPTTHALPQGAGSREGVQHARHHLSGTGLRGHVRCFRLQQLGVHEHHAQQVVQPVEQHLGGLRLDAGCHVVRSGWGRRGSSSDAPTATHAAGGVVLRRRCPGHPPASPACARASRRRSATEPPAVRTFLDLAAVDPVVNRAAADPYMLARLQDRHGSYDLHPWASSLRNYGIGNSPTVVHAIGTDRRSSSVDAAARGCQNTRRTMLNG